jgi:hypothetical protein
LRSIAKFFPETLASRAAGVPKTSPPRGVTTLAPFVPRLHDTLKPPPESSGNRVAALRELLARDPICREIVQYLTLNSEAADTAPGIAEWWISRDIEPTKQALSTLQACGVVQSYPVQDDTLVYAFTKNAVLRQTLARYLQGTIVAHPAEGR